MPTSSLVRRHLLMGGEGPLGCGIEEEEKDREGAVSRGRRRTSRVLCQGGGEGQRRCGAGEEEKDCEGAVSGGRRRTARVRCR
eukprot:240964-Rhodomonas_salina.1